MVRPFLALAAPIAPGRPTSEEAVRDAELRLCAKWPGSVAGASQRTENTLFSVLDLCVDGIMIHDMTAEPKEVALDVATRADSSVLSNLLELYIHDLSEVFPVELGADGRFGYPRLELYWSEPQRRFPFLVRCDGRVGGFVLVTRGSPVTDNPNVLDVAEFFVLRRYRRSGVGRRAAMLLWQRHPGAWIVRVSEGNRPAVPFWTRVIAEFSGGAAAEFSREGQPHAWRVFAFESVAK